MHLREPCTCTATSPRAHNNASVYYKATAQCAASHMQHSTLRMIVIIVRVLLLCAIRARPDQKNRSRTMAFNIQRPAGGRACIITRNIIHRYRARIARSRACHTRKGVAHSGEGGRIELIEIPRARAPRATGEARLTITAHVSIIGLGAYSVWRRLGRIERTT